MKFFNIENQLLFAHLRVPLRSYRLLPTLGELLKSKVAHYATPLFSFRRALFRYNLCGMLRTQLYADPRGLFLHDLILESCRRNAQKTALVDISCNRRLTYAEYGDAVECVARGMIAAGVQPGDVIAIFLANSWEFCAAFHGAQLAGAIPTLLNPTYREREVRFQLENSGAVLLITDAGNIEGINLA